MQKIKVTNETKNITLEFLTPALYSQVFSHVSFWAAEDVYTRKYIAEKYGTFILYGWEGFGLLPKINDIRNKTINSHGSTRVSGHSDELELTLSTEPYLYCSEHNGENIYNTLISCFTNDFSNIRIEFDLGCRKVYQYYSLQEEDPNLGTFKFKGAIGGNYYFKDGDNVIKFPIDGKTNSFIVPVEAGAYTSKENDLNNVINVPSGITKDFSFNVLLKTTYLLKIQPTNKVQKGFISRTTISVNGISVKFSGKYESITKTYDGRFLDENGQEITPDVARGGGEDVKLPAELFVGTNNIKIEANQITTVSKTINNGEGEYECELTLDTMGTFS